MKHLFRFFVLLASLLFSGVVWSLPPGTTEAVNFRDPTLDHRFVTALPGEVTIVRAKGVDHVWPWQEESDRFPVWASWEVGLVPICRFATRPVTGWNSHFYSADLIECKAVKENPDLALHWQFETEAAFYVKPARWDAGVGGHFCSSGTIPIFRLYNNGLSGQPNHAYTSSYRVRSQYLAKGWKEEGLLGCGPAVTDKMVTANYDAVLLGMGPNNCTYDVSVFEVDSLTRRDICNAQGLAAVSVVIGKQDGEARLPMKTNILQVNPDTAQTKAMFSWQPRVWSWVVADDFTGTLYVTSGVRGYTENGVYHETPGSVSVISADGKLVRDYPEGAVSGYTPFYMALVGDKLYVLNQRYPGGSGATSLSDWVVVLDRHSGMRLALIAVGPNPLGAAYDPKRGLLYVSSEGDLSTGAGASVVAIDVRSDRVVANLGFPGKVPIGLFVDTERDRLWVASSSLLPVDTHQIRVADLATGQWIATLDTPVRFPMYFAPVYRNDGTRELWMGFYGATSIGRIDLDQLTSQETLPSVNSVLGMDGRLLYQ